MKPILWGLCLACLAALQTETLDAQQKILFLRLRLQNDTVRLVHSSIRPGVLKQARRTGRVEYECRSSAGAVLFTGAMDDPSLRRYEYEDPARPGRIAVKQVQVKDVEFTLRLPYREDMGRIDIYRCASGSASGTSVNAVRTRIGSIDVRNVRGTP